MSRHFVLVASIFGFLAVALGAFGAHGLNPLFESFAETERHLEWWSIAGDYHLVHAAVLLVLAFAVALRKEVFDRRSIHVAFLCICAGTVVFSGSLYALALTGDRWLGAITPIGGILFLVGWGALGVFGLSVRADE